MEGTTTWQGIEILSDEECWTLLASSVVGRLAVSITDHPDIFPVNHVVDRGELIFRTAEGTKLAASVLGRGVAYEIDGYDTVAREAWSVVVKGQAREVERLDDLLHVGELPLFPWHVGPKLRWVRVVPGEITGRRFRVSADALVTGATGRAIDQVSGDQVGRAQT
jgi:uncharacterized protein